MPTIIKDPAEIGKSQSVRRRSKHSVCGLPWFDVAFGPDADTGELTGTAYGVLALGDSATGVIAIGKISRGFIAVGVVAFGVVAVGVGAISVLSSFGVLATSFFVSGGVLSIGWNAWGVMAWGATSMGTLAIGYDASGVVAIGYRAEGVLAIAHYAQGVTAFGTHVLDSDFRRPTGPTMPQLPAVLRNHPKLAIYLNVLNLFWIAPLVRGLWLQHRRGWIFPNRSEVRVVFEGRGGGRSHKSRWTRLHSAAGVLKILVTEDELWVWIPRYFPFMGAGVSYDLEHRIPACDITLITHNDATFVVPFAVDGAEGKLELWPREPAKFLDAISSLP